MIRLQTKRIIRAVYSFHCGYCGISESQAGAELTYDHFRPQSQGGTDDAANLVYACHACNEFKGNYWSEDENTRLLHPLLDPIDAHIFEEADGVLRSLTDLGQIYIERLQLNRRSLVANRMERQRMLRVESHLAEMSTVLRDILSEIKKRQA